jgi:hypothetical protein
VQHAIKERRAQSRNHVHMWAVVRRHGSMVREKIIIANLSRDGFKMRSGADFAPDSIFFLELAIGLMAEVRVVRREPLLPEYGCRFLYPLAPSIVQGILDRAELPRDIKV